MQRAGQEVDATVGSFEVLGADRAWAVLQRGAMTLAYNNMTQTLLMWHQGDWVPQKLGGNQQVPTAWRAE